MSSKQRAKQIAIARNMAKSKKKNSQIMKQIAPAIYSGSGNYYQRSLRSYARGKGNYAMLASAAKNSKGAFAPDFGARAGSVIGEGIQSLFKALGFGDYKVEHNTLLADLQGAGPPVMKNYNGRSHVIRHREYLGNVYTAANGVFNLNSFPINPGLNQTFPWLASVAAGFEQYRIDGMIWEFKSTSADALNSTNTALGSVIMATEYDSSRAVFQNQQQMENHEFASSCRQSASMLHAIECKKSLTPVSELWVRTGSVPTGDDERLYDFGLFQIATVGSQSASAVNIGELWVTYEITFFKPQLLTGLGLNLLTDHFKNATTVAVGTNYFGISGTSMSPVSGSNLGCLINGANGNVINFPTFISEGNFLITFVVYGSAGTVSAPTFTLVNCSQLQYWNGDTASISQTPNGATAATLLINIIVKVTGQNATITLSSGGYPASPSGMDLWISQINSSIVT